MSCLTGVVGWCSSKICLYPCLVRCFAPLWGCSWATLRIVGVPRGCPPTSSLDNHQLDSAQPLDVLDTHDRFRYNPSKKAFEAQANTWNSLDVDLRYHWLSPRVNSCLQPIFSRRWHTVSPQRASMRMPGGFTAVSSQNPSTQVKSDSISTQAPPSSFKNIPGRPVS